MTWTGAAIREEMACQAFPPALIAPLTDELERLRLLALYYQEHVQRDWVMEDETRAFLVVPLLKALGWDETRIKLELGQQHQEGRGNVDIMCFARPFHTQPTQQGTVDWNYQHAVLVVEVKARDRAASDGDRQAFLYAGHLPSCRCTVATNGLDYRVFHREAGGSFPKDPPDEPNASFSLLHPQAEAVPILKMLAPWGVT